MLRYPGVSPKVQHALSTLHLVNETGELTALVNACQVALDEGWITKREADAFAGLVHRNAREEAAKILAGTLTPHGFDFPGGTPACTMAARALLAHVAHNTPVPSASM